MNNKLEEICNKIIEAGNIATPRPWKHDLGNWEIEQESTRYGVCPINTQYRRGCEEDDTNPINPMHDGDFIVLAANYSDKMAKAVLILNEALSNYCNCIRGVYTCTSCMAINEVEYIMEEKE